MNRAQVSAPIAGIVGLAVVFNLCARSEQSVDTNVGTLRAESSATATNSVRPVLPAPEPRDSIRNDWAQRMFDVERYDFGVVARGAYVSHRFRVTNRSLMDVHIADVRTTCGCTAVQSAKRSLNAHESTHIDVMFDTHRYQRNKTSNLIVRFDRPQPAEVTIPVKIYIRTDLELAPGSLNFGTVGQGENREEKLEITYVGSDDWKIAGVVTNNRYLQARAVEMSRGNGLVQYELLATLSPDAPAQMLHQWIVIVTNDRNCRRIPVPTFARINPAAAPKVVHLRDIGRW